MEQIKIMIDITILNKNTKFAYDHAYYSLSSSTIEGKYDNEKFQHVKLFSHKILLFSEF